MDIDERNREIHGQPSKSITAEEQAGRDAARRISPLEYFGWFLDYRGKYLDDTSQWNRDAFLAYLKAQKGTTATPSSPAISGKHNYVINTLLPQLMADPTNKTWNWLTPAILDACDLPPTARDSMETWAKDTGLAEKMMKQFA